ncbi:Solute carrier family 35 member F6 [Coccomyxa sp. Obi]|nr:Solute carrier family 35 member F6 [Coccomyxa sp. Obi]
MVQASIVVSVVGLLLFGTISSIFSKVVYQTEGEDMSGHPKYFKKPWASTALMFLAMVMCLPIAWIAAAIESRRKKSAASERKPLLGEEGETSTQQGAAAKLAAKSASFKEIMILGLPMAFDLTATLLMSIGLLYVTASVYQMLRGAEILFSAIFAVTCLKRKLYKRHYIGIAFCLAGITMVGASSLLTPSGDATSDAGKVLLGMVLIVVAQAVQAAQVVMEDYAMSNVGLAPLQVVGYEGVLGVIALAILLTIVQFLLGKDEEGIHEDTRESIHMITHSIPFWAIPAVLVANSLSLLLYNVAGMFVTEELGAVSRTVFESARTLFVWLGDLLLFYTLDGRLGEGWDRSSYLQAAGFAVLVVGTLIYSRGDQLEESEEKEKQREHHGAAAMHKQRGPIFRPNHTMARHSLGNIHHRRWRQAANALIAAARLHPDEEQPRPTAS